MKHKLLKFVRSYPGVLALSIGYFIAILIIQPIPNAPFCDSWAYTKITNNFLDTGRIQFVGLGAMNLVLHILWGALFCKFLGFTFAVLNISTLTLSFVASITFYLILKQIKFAEPEASLASLILIANPIFFINSFSFMTDVPFMCWMLLAILFYLKSLEEKGNLFLFLGSLFSVFAFLIRQNGMLVSLAVFIFYCIGDQHRKRLNSIKLFILVGIPIITTVVFLFWHHLQPNRDPMHLSLRSTQEAIFILEYMGLFCLPLIFAYLAKFKNYYLNVCKNHPLILLVSICIIAANTATAISTATNEKLMPYFGSWISKYGVFYNEMLVGSRQVVIPPIAWLWVTVATAIGSVALLIFIFTKAQNILKAVISNEFIAKKIRRIFLSVGILSIIFALLLIFGERRAFEVYSIWYNYLFRIGSMKRPIEVNFHKIVTFHNNLLTWLIAVASMTLMSFLAIIKLFPRGSKKQVVTFDSDNFSKVFSSPNLLVYLVTLLQVMFILIMRAITDRYLIILIPGTVIFIMECAKELRFSKAIFIIMLGLFFAYSVIIASDTSAWNQTAWERGEYLIKQGIPAKQIDGGFAWNGWHYQKTLPRVPAQPKSFYPKVAYLQEMFTDIDNEYTVSFSGIEGYEVIKRIECNSLLALLTNKKKFIYVLHRID